MIQWTHSELRDELHIISVPVHTYPPQIDATITFRRRDREIEEREGGREAAGVKWWLCDERIQPHAQSGQGKKKHTSC